MRRARRRCKDAGVSCFSKQNLEAQRLFGASEELFFRAGSLLARCFKASCRAASQRFSAGCKPIAWVQLGYPFQKDRSAWSLRLFAAWQQQGV